MTRELLSHPRREFLWAKLNVVRLFYSHNKMETFTRDFLQGLPEQNKQERIDTEIARFIHHLKAAATLGERSYFHTPSISLNSPYGMKPPLQAISNEELVAGIQLRFPDCLVSYQENWVETAANTRQLQKGILIDWS